jgi:hypothetical protein
VLGAPASIMGSELLQGHLLGLRPFALPRPNAAGCLMYTKATCLQILYIRIIILTIWASLFWSTGPYRGGATLSIEQFQMCSIAVPIEG